MKSIIQDLTDLQAVSVWPELVGLLRKPLPEGGPHVWDYPGMAYRALGGEGSCAPAASAVYCLLHSIHLVDDMLDDDPRGLFRTLGSAKTANLALACQAAAVEALQAVPEADRRVAACLVVARAALATASGQNLEVQPRGEPDETRYWRDVDAKGPPLFGAALALGAILAGADEELVLKIEALGQPIGRLIQASDDLADALKTPMAPDWATPSSNLALLYPQVADHPQRARFMELLSSLQESRADAATLGEAQQILLSCGAVSYCCKHILHNDTQGRELCAQLPLPNPDALLEIFEHLIMPTKTLLQKIG